MKFNIYNTSKVNGEEIENTKVELELSVDELAAGYKHTIDLLEHSYEIKSLVQGIVDIVVETITKINDLKKTEIKEDFNEQTDEQLDEQTKEVF